MLHHTLEVCSQHPFFRTHKGEMSERALYFKEKMDNYHLCSKNEKFSIFKDLMEQGFSWPGPLRHEGFWCEVEDKDALFKEYPFPIENEMTQDEVAEFLSKLGTLESKAGKFTYMGFSTCRCCGEKVGTKTFYSDLFAWPEGFKHYIKEHKVKPSAAFVLHVRGLIT